MGIPADYLSQHITRPENFLEQGLEKVAHALHNAIQSEVDLQHTFAAGIGRLGLFGMLALLEPGSDNFYLKAVTHRFPNPAGAREPSDFPFSGHPITLEKIPTLKKLLETGEPEFVVHGLNFIYQILPNDISALWKTSTQPLDAPCIISTLKTGGQVHGVVLLCGSNLAPEDLSTVEKFSHQLEIAREETYQLTHGDGDANSITFENPLPDEQVDVDRSHLQLLFDISQAVSASLEVDEILSKTIGLMTQAMNGVLGEAFTYLPEEDRLSLRAVFGKTIDIQQADAALYFRPGKGLVGWVAKNLKTVYAPQANLDPRWWHIPGLDDDTQSALISPVLSENHLLAVICVFHRDAHAFSEQHVRLMQAICQEIGLALANANRYEQVQRRLAEITLMQNLVHTITQRHEVKILLEELVAQLVEKLHYSQVLVFLLDQGQLLLKACHGPIPPKTSFSTTKGIMGRVVKTHEIAFVPDVSLDPDYYSCGANIVAELDVPIIRNDDLIGIISIRSSKPNQLTIHDRALLQVLAGQISVAIENALLYEQIQQHAYSLEQTIAQRTAELSALYLLSQEISQPLNYEDLIKLLLRHLRSATGSDFVAGCLALGSFCSLFIEADRPILTNVCKTVQLRWEIIVGSESGHLRRPPDCQFTQPDDFNSELPAIQHVGTLIPVPIVLDDEIVGFLAVGSQFPFAFSAAQERLLTTFANQAGSAVQRLNSILSAQQKQLENLVEHLPIGVMLLDSDLRILVTNPVGRSILDILGEEHASGHQLNHLGPLTIQEVIHRQSQLAPIEIFLPGPTEQRITVQLRPARSNFSEENSQWIMILRDVTEESAYMARIQTQERLATVGQMAAGIAHDFNNIMAAIMVYTDLMQYDTSISAGSREKMDTIQEQVQRATSLIRQILDFSRQSAISYGKLDLLPIMKELDKMLVRILPETIQTRLNYTPDVYWINGDPTRLQQVFLNLAVNAKDAMPEGGMLHFTLGKIVIKPGDTTPVPEMPPGEWVRIRVADTGDGIPVEIREHIFEPFFTTKPPSMGTGLGLAQVYGIIKQHNGFINVHSRSGMGTSFNIFFPALEVETRQALPAESSARLHGEGQTALVVEDDPAAQEAIRILLSEQGFNVLTAYNGDEALQIIDELASPIAVVVSDIVMPAMGGIELSKEIARRDPATRILFVTGHPLSEETQLELRQGEKNWLLKPFTIQEFNQAIQDLSADN